jgi:glycosyltransferase involved in cell wall biosynthesis
LAALLNKVELLLLSGRVDSIVAVSRHCKATLEKMAGLRRRMAVIPNGVPSAPPGLLPSRVDGNLNVGFVGDFSRNKGIHTFLEAARILERMPARFTVFGNGPEHAIVEKAVNRGLVRWVDKESDPAKIYPQIDILVFPSRLKGPDTTGCPMVILEAKAYGVPTVASDIPGVREMIEDGKDGVLVKGWDPRDYATAVERLISGSETRQAIAKCARQNWACRYSADLMAQHYSRLVS